MEKYDLNDVVFVKSGSKLGKFCSVNAGGNIYFTTDNAKPLKLEKAGQVLVGYNEKTKEIVLKPCDVEEYGSVLVKSENHGYGISAAHLKKRFTLASRYEPRKEGILIVLKPVETEIAAS